VVEGAVPSLHSVNLMPIDLADALYQHLLDRFPADHDYPRGALYVEGMPPLVAELLGRTLDRWLEHELDSLESRWFDFDDPAVRTARAELVVALGRTARVPRGAWAETLRYAVGLVVRHLITPARALTDATFEGQPESLPAEIVRSRLFTFKAYNYLPEVADAYIGQKKPDSIDPDTLHGLLLRIDRRVTADYGPEEWQRLLGPLFKLAKSVPDLKGVPASHLEQFFSAKGQTEIAESLRERGDRLLGEAALHDLLSKDTAAAPFEPSPEDDERSAEEPDDAMPDQETVIEPSAREPDEEAPAPEADDEDAPGDEVEDLPVEGAVEEEIHEGEVGRGDVADRFSDSPAAMPAPPAEPEPLWKRFAEGLKGPTLDTAVPAETLPPDEPEHAGPSRSSREELRSDTRGEQRPLWKKFFPERGEPESSGAQVETAPPSSLGELEERVLGRSNARQRKRYVADLFQGDDAAYESALRTLEHCNTWSEAAQVIAREVFRKHGVDIYSDAAVDFTDTVNANFEE
jgi:hypothetical protein